MHRPSIQAPAGVLVNVQQCSNPETVFVLIFQVLIAASVKVTAFCNTAPSRFLEVGRRFRGAAFTTFILNMDAVSISETPVKFCYTTRCNIAKVYHPLFLHSHQWVLAVVFHRISIFKLPVLLSGLPTYFFFWVQPRHYVILVDPVFYTLPPVQDSWSFLSSASVAACLSLFCSFF